MKQRCRLLLAGALAGLSCFVASLSLATTSRQVVGTVTSHEVQRGQSLTAIGARYGADVAALLRANRLKRDRPLKPGQLIEVDNRHIVPAGLEDGILINVPQRMLFLMRGGIAVAAWPVGLGKPDWPTPLGRFKVVAREIDKPWCIPPSIQEEMQLAGKEIITPVPPGPDNPLGKHWMGLSMRGIGIHGTIAPTSIYQFRSHGCIRLHPDDAQALFEQVEIGTPGMIVYEPLLLAELDNGQRFAEVHRDIYERRSIKRAHIKQMQDSWPDSVQALGDILRLREGIAREVTIEDVQLGDHAMTTETTAK